MDTSHAGRTIAAAAAIAGTFFAATACGSAESATGTITKPAQAPGVESSVPAHRAYPADGRENRQGERTYPADGRENRQGERTYPADGRENRNAGPWAFAWTPTPPADR